MALDADVLADLRAEIAAYFDQVATVSRSTAVTVAPTTGQTVSDGRGGRVSDNRGGFTDTQAVTASYPCRVAEKIRPPQEQQVADVPTSVSRFVITMPYTADVRFRDEITVNGNVYRVEGCNPGVSDALALTAECERIS